MDIGYTNSIACNVAMGTVHDLPYIFPSSDRIIFLRPQGGYIASASWKACSISGAHTPSASLAISKLSFSEPGVRAPEEAALCVYVKNNSYLFNYPNSTESAFTESQALG